MIYRQPIITKVRWYIHGDSSQDSAPPALIYQMPPIPSCPPFPFWAHAKNISRSCCSTPPGLVVNPEYITYFYQYIFNQPLCGNPVCHLFLGNANITWSRQRSHSLNLVLRHEMLFAKVKNITYSTARIILNSPKAVILILSSCFSKTCEHHVINAPKHRAP